MVNSNIKTILSWVIWKEQIRRLNAKKQKSSSCDNGNSRKGPRVRDNQPFELNFGTRPFFIGQEASIVARLQHNLQTDKKQEMPRDEIMLCFRLSA